MRNKNEEVWRYIKSFDLVGLLETWVQEQGWEKIQKMLPKEFNWERQSASRQKRKERAKGGMIVGIRKGITEIREE